MVTQLQDKFIQDHAFRTRLSQCVDLPSPPGVAVRILQIGESLDTSIADVAEVVQLDPALAAKIIRVANSPMYAQRRKSDNLRQALMLLGLNATMTLALSFSLVKSLRAGKKDGLDYAYFWKRCISTAALCRVLAERMHVLPSEDLFLTGLLNGIGILAIDRIAPGFCSSVGIAQYSWSTLRENEKNELGADHAMIGGWLLANWNFPEALSYGVGYVFEPNPDIPADYANFVKISAAGARLADILFTEEFETALAQTADEVGKMTGLDSASISGVIESASRDTQDLVTLFEIDADTAYMEAIAARAKEVLLLRSLQTLQETAVLQESQAALETKARELQERSERDALTGLYNRSYFDQSIKLEFEFSLANGSPLTIAFVDLDHFKSINDSYGHQVGDEVLKRIAGLLLMATRSGDIAARYGGEEFVMIFPGTDVKGAQVAIGRLMGLVQNSPHEIPESQPLTVTASIGVAVHNDKASMFDSAEALLRAADRAVYTAKRNGRNQICFYEADI
jgi:diguanylate cyclase (GGDEF)-like protein